MIKLTDEQVSDLRSKHGWAKETIRAIEAEVLRLNGGGGEAATIAGLESATGHLSALVDDLRGLMARAMANMKALHDSAQPVDEPRGDFDARVPCDVFRRFVDEHAALLHDLHHSPHELPEAAPQPQHAEPIQERCQHGVRWENRCNTCDDLQQAAPGAVVEGWQLVPVVATREMLKAGTEARTEFRGMHHMQSEAVYLAMLSAAPKPSPVEGWRDIETAPKDIDVILYGLWAGEIRGEDHSPEHGVGHYSGSGDYPGFDWSSTRGDTYAEWCKPTHWMPLPAAPSAPKPQGE